MSSALRSTRAILWGEQTPRFQAWLKRHADASVLPLANGREAALYSLNASGVPHFVVKLWHEGRQADAVQQYGLLDRAVAAGLPVSPPAGWGYDRSGRSVLATRFAGRPLERASPVQLRRLASILAEIHAAPPSVFAPVLTRDAAGVRGGLMARHCAEVRGEPDLETMVRTVVDVPSTVEPALVHGDFHLGNVLISGNALSIIDWTEARIGDRADDLAWAGVLLWIYSGAAAYRVFVEAYAGKTGRPLEWRTLRQAELLAGLRWLLLSRRAPVPIEWERIMAARYFVSARLPEASRRLRGETDGEPSRLLRVG